MNKYILKIISIAKKYIDKAYYSYYTLDKEALIREAFPWINYVGDYTNITLFMKTNSLDTLETISQVITTYYWWEVNRLIKEDNFQQIERYQWLLDFCQSMKDYKTYLNIEENESK